MNLVAVVLSMNYHCDYEMATAKNLNLGEESGGLTPSCAKMDKDVQWQISKEVGRLYCMRRQKVIDLNFFEGEIIFLYSTKIEVPINFDKLIVAFLGY